MIEHLQKTLEKTNFPSHFVNLMRWQTLLVNQNWKAVNAEWKFSEFWIKVKTVGKDIKRKSVYEPQWSHAIRHQYSPEVPQWGGSGGVEGKTWHIDTVWGESFRCMQILKDQPPSRSQNWVRSENTHETHVDMIRPDSFRIKAPEIHLETRGTWG